MDNVKKRNTSEKINTTIQGHKVTLLFSEKPDSEISSRVKGPFWRPVPDDSFFRKVHFRASYFGRDVR